MPNIESKERIQKMTWHALNFDVTISYINKILESFPSSAKFANTELNISRLLNEMPTTSSLLPVNDEMRNHVQQNKNCHIEYTHIAMSTFIINTISLCSRLLYWFKTDEKGSKRKKERAHTRTKKNKEEKNCGPNEEERKASEANWTKNKTNSNVKQQINLPSIYTRKNLLRFVLLLRKTSLSPTDDNFACVFFFHIFFSIPIFQSCITISQVMHLLLIISFLWE